MRPNVEDRIGRIERDIRRVRIVLLLVLVVAAGLLLAMVLPQGRADAVAVFAATALLLAGAETAVHVWRRGQGVPDIVRAKKFEVVDERGHIFVEIGETTDGRGAVVTHDGDTHVILSPAHLPVERKPEAPAAHAADVSGGDGTDVQPVLVPAHQDASAADEDARAHESSSAAPSKPPASGAPHAGVKIELVYRGDGTYEAKISGEEDGDRSKRRRGR
jgi:hypothetical protein